MNQRHTIRLRGPWQYEVIEHFECDDNSPGFETQGRVKLPCDWREPPWGDFFGRVRFTRTFNWPEPLAPHERLALVFDLAATSESADLNGTRLPPCNDVGKPARADVTDCIAIHNTLTLEFQRTKCKAENAEPGSADFIREVYLEVTRREH